jgi:hypothetical protein
MVVKVGDTVRISDHGANTFGIGLKANGKPLRGNSPVYPDKLDAHGVITYVVPNEPTDDETDKRYFCVRVLWPSGQEDVINTYWLTVVQPENNNT